MGLEIRIDDRLVHAQVATVWTKALNVTKIMVIDDSAAQDDVQSYSLKLSCPSNIRCLIISVSSAIKRLKEENNNDWFIIIKGVNTLHRLKEVDLPINKVTIGHMGRKDNTKELTTFVHVSDEQIELFKELSETIEFSLQLLPQDEPIPLNKFI